MKALVVYAHAGSSNHGCEAILRSTINILNVNLTVYSFDKQSDIRAGFEKISTINAVEKIDTKMFINICDKISRKIFNSYSFGSRYIYRKLLRTKRSIVMSIGGDNYCYSFPGYLINANKILSKRNKTILWGCSISPEKLDDQRIVEDLRKFSIITTRESLTYNALLSKGIVDNVRLYPDPAFVLPSKFEPLPENFIESDTVGINVSPLVQKLENKRGIVYQNYSELIKFIIDKTKMNIALIPHVVRRNNNDIDVLKELYQEFSSTNRVVLLQEHDCSTTKGFISRCRFFVGARTHATIAAYSSLIPTLVVGYSIKSKGIAKDVFGTFDNYVVSVQALMTIDTLVNKFIWLIENEKSIKNHLEQFMPNYICKAWEAGTEISKLMNEL